MMYFLNILKLLDAAVNVVIIGFIKVFVTMPPACGNAHYTTSEALTELRDLGSKPACICCKILTFVFKWFLPVAARKGYDHCTQSLVGIPYDITNS